MNISDTATAPAERSTPTRYAVKSSIDGRYAAIGYAQNHPVIMRTDRDHCWTWDTYTQAVIIALRLLDRLSVAEWSIVPL